ncbi:hypothetical protein TRFO_26939 [Tritrichomonas foetus]|uniref:Uncharacterized protein n=1 Tax=Tritrichomonas foetus TaxID=1144522 RepID=A0A1J4K6I5_9EUKA|nr:hypothetical protein TRFO_26939 [Tritrichomonas foetus]|eukprot:OHT05318.1 hypothetical protein TRFO_26939 [Tritrichomonas foetus]
MSQSPPQQTESMKASNCFAAVISLMLNNPKYKPIESHLAQLSNLLIKIDSEIPGSAESLLNAIVNGQAQH